MNVVMDIIDGAIVFAKDKLDTVMNAWDNLEDNKKKLLIGCIAAAVTIIAVASIAYSIGKARGQKYLEEEDF